MKLTPGVASLLFLVSLPSTAPAPAATTELVSVSTAGEQGNAASAWCTISADGRLVAFGSLGSNLVPADTNGCMDAFVRDRATRATERASVSSAGEQGNSNSDEYAISADGRFVAFRSFASNLVPGDTNACYDVFVRDRATGATERVSLSSAGEQGNGESIWPAISADGRFAVFGSYASNLVPGDTNGCQDVFVRDRATGATERVSLSSAGEQGNWHSFDPAISADGRFAVFGSYASNLVPGDTNGCVDVFVRDRATGATERVSVSSAGEQGNSQSYAPAISADGRFVAFTSSATNLVPGDTNSAGDAFVRDRATGATERVSVSSDGQQGNDSSGEYDNGPTLSADGRFVAFHSDASNLVPGDSNGCQDVFVRDRAAGTTERISLSSAGEQGNWHSSGPAISADGRFVAFSSYASNLVPGDTNNTVDVFVRDRGIGPGTITQASFEEERRPFSAFCSGPGEAATGREALISSPSAHSGVYAMSSEVSDQAITGLRLALPTEPTGPAEVMVSAWAYVQQRTVGDASAFLGLALGDAYPTAASGWSGYLGWEALTDSTSQYQLAGPTEAEARGLPSGAWHLVQLRYVRAANRLTLWLDGVLVAEKYTPAAASRAPTYVVLGALGQSSSARQHVYFDDVQVALPGYGGPPTRDHAFALIEGQEEVAEGQTQTYSLHYGNGYPMLGLVDVTETLPDRIYVAASLPAGYSFLSADPAPARVVGRTPVWDLPMPAAGQTGYIHLNVVATPTGLAAPITDRIWAWATTDAGAATSDPPNPPDWTNPTDPVWGAPQDTLPQQIELEPRADLWVRKTGPRFASPGDSMVYPITVGNCGSGAASAITVRDLLPDLLGNGDRIVGNIGELIPGETWASAIWATLPWGVPNGTLLLNQAYVPTAAGEIVVDNNQSEWQTTVLGARDPNQISVSPEGGADRGQMLTYSLQCENNGLGTAYGVYATATLDGKLDGATLLVSDPGKLSYDPTSRTLVWEVGTLGPSEGAGVWFTVNVAGNARRARPLIGQAVVYFPSVPEETPTNVVLSVVNGSFPDVPWDHWAVLPVELCCENGIVTGYGDATYRPEAEVKRDQMAVYVARALCGGDENVPISPPPGHFPDVAPDYWAYRYIEYAADQRVVFGYGDGTYRPAESVGRGQMAAYIARAMAGGDEDVPPGPPEPTFVDVATDHPYYDYVEYIVKAGVVQGYGDGTYRPATIVNRGQMAMYVARAFALPL